MRAVVFAYHEVGAAALEALLTSDIDVVAVFTHRDDPSEGGWFRSVARLAAEHGVPAHAPEDPNHPLWVERISELAPDMILSAHYRSMLGEDIRSLCPGACFNLHGSLLPAYRGRCPINWVLVNGETTTGVTLHHMTAVADAGDIIAQRKVEIDEDDTALTLTARICESTGELLRGCIGAIINGTIEATAQDDSIATTMPGRCPEDGRIDWSQPAHAVSNLIRAVTAPWPGAFSESGSRTFHVWEATVMPGAPGVAPGTVLQTDDALVIACGEDAIRIDAGQPADGVWSTGVQLAEDMNFVDGMRVGHAVDRRGADRRKKVLILGANGFIGSHLSERLLSEGGYEVHAMDLHSTNLDHLIGTEHFNFHEGDISINREWIEYHVRKCDVVLPLVAIATPIEYVRNPLRVFQLDFEENLRIIRDCVRHGTRVIFPSTSEVYGMCGDSYFNENTSPLVTGPIKSQRWIYSCSKQLLDRVIWAYGQRDGLRFSLFRPFNWIGPRLDSLDSARIGSSRAITQLILNLVEGTPIQLVDGGEQKRCFTDVDDGVDCLYRLIADDSGRVDGGIVNVGNPEHEYSIRELAETLVAKFDAHELRGNYPPFAGYRVIESGAYYGKGYQDVQHRRPSIENAKRLVGWTPKVGFEESIERTLDWFLRDHEGKLAQAALPVG
ncbi:MAG: bifunctional UDP-4-amino-4-deoxy-L-arabinose formyltransferase/UDP-glucuronic acid oxidase ArnA [Phycisphaerales bacterium]|nr:bifunctional UDP-4-amino-4-deoxy-L-arabinose formyltransferase/UDP-glucuronic acid oxidase ArnA [Phycisphaerales bacterium]